MLPVNTPTLFSTYHKRVHQIGAAISDPASSFEVTPRVLQSYQTVSELDR